MPRGAKPGERRGGRSKNTPNKRTVELQALIEEAKAKSFIQPLEYMLYILNTAEDDAARRWAAEKAAPYCHPRAGETFNQPTVAINGPTEVRLVIIDNAEQSRHRSSARLLSATPAGHS
jgi:hypothetical protein